MSLSSYGSSGGSESLAGGGAPNYIPSWAANLATYHNAFTPEQFGAKGNDSSHDDAPAIEAAIAIAVAAAQADGSGVCAVIFDSSKTYYALRAPIQNPTINGGPAYTYGQIGLPYVSSGVNDGAFPPPNPIYVYLAGSNPLAATTISNPPRSAATIQSTYTGGTYSATYGTPCVLSGVPWEQFYAGTLATFYSAVVPIFDNLSIIVPNNPTIGGINLFAHIGARAGSIRIQAVDPSNIPTNPWAIGLITPGKDNFNDIRWEGLTIVGFYQGLQYSAHFEAVGLEIDWCHNALAPLQAVGYGAYIGRLLTQDDLIIWGDTSPTSPVPIRYSLPTVVGQWVIENVSQPLTAAIQDDNNLLQLDAPFDIFDAPASLITVGGQMCAVRNVAQSAGRQTAPTIPGSGTAFQNPFFRDAYVTITGGTVTAITMKQGSTAGPVSVGTSSFTGIVPSNAYLTLTYSAAPTWTWTTF